MRARVIVVVVCGLLVLIAESRAATIGLGGFSGSETVIDFTGLDVGPTLVPITVGGLTMDSSVSQLRIYPFDVFGVWPETPLASAGAYLSNQNTQSTSMELLFATPVNRVGMWINGGNTATNWTFTAFDAGGNTVGSHVFVFNLVDGFPDPSVFAGIEFSTAFTKVTIVETIDNFQYTNIDDIRFDAHVIPEPGTAVLLGLGVLGVAGLACRRRRARER